MKRGYGFVVILSLLLVFSIAFALSQGLEPIREQRLKYGPSLYILNITASPGEIQPGSDADITFIIKNVAPYSLRDIIMNMELPSQFAPKETSKKKIRSLDGLNISEIVFGVIALPDSQEGIYKVPFTITYIDDIGNSYSENTTISLKISATPKIFAEVASSDIYEGNLLGSIDIRLANTGVGDIKFLVVELLPSAQYEVIGSNKDYIGKIDSDEYETVDFKIKVTDVKNTQLLLKLDYSDSNNKEYTKALEIPLRVISAKDAGIKQNSNTLIILVIMGVLILYIVYRQIRKRSRKH